MKSAGQLQIMKNWERWYPFIAMLSIDVAFAISNILLKEVIGGQGMNHFVFITYRQLVSTIFMAPVALFVERNSRPKLTMLIMFYIFFSAIVGASLTQYLFLVGIEYTSATFSCAFLNIVPVITFLMALPFKLETVDVKNGGGRAKVIGTLVCLGGAILLTLYKGMPLIRFSEPTISQQAFVERAVRLRSSSNWRERWIVGSLALFAGTLLWSTWFLLQSKIVKRYPCQYSSTAIMALFSSLQSAILSFSIYRDLSVWVLKGKLEVITVLYTGMIGSGLCYVGMSWCVKKKGPVFTAAFSPFVQMIAAMFEVPVLHEQLHLGSLIGSLVVVVGLYILLWGKNKESRICEIQKITEARKEQVPPVPVPGDRA
ncbi:hypothetical protein M9H77_25100 [Catharanthus roseus]|uniref:Uncharacterized protein n=1 Tax=Catharanthus roseus TaxID=4058 RepID=A0ACC0A5Y7_CATRO|nr:hypothetical protein M9H77_25100 [Catharanthus roseus]